MSDFGDFSGGGGGFGAEAFATSSDDPTADFLAREQAMLGADAAQFGNELAVNEGNTSGIIMGGSNSFNGAPDASFNSQFGGNEETFGGGYDGFRMQNEQSFTQHPQESMQVTESSPYESEPEHIRQWKEDFNTIVAQRDAKSKAKHDVIVSEAKEALERFYAEYNEKKAKTINRNKEMEKLDISKRSETPVPEKIWERVWQNIEEASQAVNTAASNKGKVDLKKNVPTDKKETKVAKAPGKGHDIARMRQVLLSLKKDPKAPGIEIAAS